MTKLASFLHIAVYNMHIVLQACSPACKCVWQVKKLNACTPASCIFYIQRAPLFNFENPRRSSPHKVYKVPRLLALLNLLQVIFILCSSHNEMMAANCYLCRGCVL